MDLSEAIHYPNNGHSLCSQLFATTKYYNKYLCTMCFYYICFYLNRVHTVLGMGLLSPSNYITRCQITSKKNRNSNFHVVVT